MNKMTAKLRTFLREEEGLTTVEYAIAGSLVGLAVVAAFSTLGDNVTAVIEELGNKITVPGAGV